MGIVTLVPNEEEFPSMCGQEGLTMKEAWEGGTQPNEDVIKPGAILTSL